MKTMKKTLVHDRITHTVGAIVVASILATGSAHALVTFTPGSAAKATEVNGNFSELADRIIDLEAAATAVAGPEQVVDCAVDSGALQAAIGAATAGTRLLIRGTCSGPITADSHNLSLRAETPGSDGISAPGVSTPVLKLLAPHISVDGLLIHAQTATDSTGLFVGLNGSATLTNLAVTNAQYDVVIGRAGAASIYDTTQVDLINAVDGGAVRIESGNGGFILGAYRNGTAEIRPAASGTTFAQIEAADGGQIRSRGATTAVTVNGKVGFYRTSSGFFEGPLTMTYLNPNNIEDAGVIALENASIRLHGGTINATTEAAGGGVIRAMGTKFVDPRDNTKGGYLYIGASGVVALQNGASAGGVSVEESSSFILEDSTLTGVVSPWDAGQTFALNIESGSSASISTNSTVNDNALLRLNGSLQLSDSTLNGNLSANQGNTIALHNATLNGNLVANQGNAIELDNATVNADRANAGTCPASWDQGIRLHVHSSLSTHNSTLFGYLEVGNYSVLAAWDTSNFGGRVDAQQWTLDALSSAGIATNGINICTP